MTDMLRILLGVLCLTLSTTGRADTAAPRGYEASPTIAKLPSLAGCYFAGDDRVCLARDATATLNGEKLSVRVSRVRLDCGETKILAIAFRRGAKTVRTLGVVAPGMLVEEMSPDDVCEACSTPSFDRDPDGRVYVRR
jgi:hypothetical protein